MKRFFWIVGVLIVVAAVVGYREYWPGNKKKTGVKTEEGAAGGTSGGRSGGRSGRRGGGGGVVTVTVASVVQKSVPVELTGIGTVEPFSTVSIRVQVTGTIQNVHFKEGQDVKKGDQLFTIDPRPFEDDLKHAQAVLAKDLSIRANL